MNMNTKRELLKRIHELRGELSLLQQQLGREHNLYWTDHLGWVSIPGSELEDEITQPEEQE